MYMWIALIIQFLGARDAGVIIKRKVWIMEPTRANPFIGLNAGVLGRECIKLFNLTKGVMYA